MISSATAAQALRNLGWRVNTSTQYGNALRNFQRGWNLGPALAVDGVLGPHTSDALLASEAARRAGRGTASAHFWFTEFGCHCPDYASCQDIVVLRALLQSLEVYRSHSGPLSIVSGYRCPNHNREVGGASDSQHMYGSAADVGRKFSWQTVRSWQRFAGIGYSRSSGLVCHVDRRDASGHDSTGGTVSAPTTWVYAS